MDGEAGNQDVSHSLAVRPSQELAPASGSPELMHLGTLSSPQKDIESLARSRLAKVTTLANMQHENDQDALLERAGFLLFAEYRETIRHADRWRGQLRQGNYDRVRDSLPDPDQWPALFAFLQGRYVPDRHPPTLQGWVQYLADVHPPFADEIAKLGAATALPEDIREQHTLITAASGQGKSELVKAMLHHYVAHDSAAVVFIDPHGTTAKEVARWPEFVGSDRLVYLDPDLEPGMTFGLNPLFPGGLNERQIGKLAEQIGQAIGELTNKLTPNMQAIATACARVLLEDGNATLLDLLRLLTDPAKGEEDATDGVRARVMERGQAHQNQALAWYFRDQFAADSLKASREGIKNRLFGLLVSDPFLEMTCGRTTVDLPALIAQRKVIIINLEPLGPAGRQAMGRLIVALIAGIGFRRGGTDPRTWVPCHLFVDEAQTLATPTFADILFELRKFGVHLTLAQQVEGINFDDVGQKALANSTAIRCAGTHLKAPLRVVFGDRDPPEMEEMRKGHFWVRWGHGATPVLLNVRSDFAKVGKEKFPRYAMTEEQWQAVRASQLRYYRPLRETPATTPAAEIPPARAPREKKPLL